MPVQLWFDTGLVGAEYVTRERWRSGNAFFRCPQHPDGGYGFARRGTYKRKTTAGTRIAHCYCRQSHRNQCNGPG
ncbi:MAG: hypothetical protein KF853_04045 [Rhodocyclaceae bacterium]|nr:hypothetical protein [Flavobacteriales bacterium]MBX3676177.1 hypothetical protein [Rhodocyclaceae bacterium]